MSVFDKHIVLDINGLLSNNIDSSKLIAEIDEAAKQHPYTKRTPVWLSVPLRSVHGETGEKASDSTGVYNSPDETIYEDTTVMQPYIKSLLDEIGAPILKVRVMKLKAKSSISEHTDSFQAPDIVRFHIPIVTHPLVEFWLDGHRYYIPPMRLHYLNVRKRHKVVNNSAIDRVHIVIDVKSTPELQSRVKKCAKILDPWF